MKEITIVESLPCEKDICKKDNCAKCYTEHSRVGQVPETFTDLTELCKKYSGKGLYIGCSYIEVGGALLYSNMVFTNDGAIFLNTDCCFKEKATPAQMWQIIKNLIGE